MRMKVTKKAAKAWVVDMWAAIRWLATGELYSRRERQGLANYQSYAGRERAAETRGDR